MERPVRVLVCVLAAAVSAAPLAAAVYTIQLTNGTSFETRYEPEDASYDSSKVVFLDETGLLITIAKTDIVSIQSDFEAKGYGRMINTTTMELGWAPNDAVEGGGVSDPYAQAQQAIQDQQQNVNFNQFVEPDALQGMPGNWVGGSFSTPQPVVVPVPVPAPAPAPSAPAGGDAPPPSDGGGQ